MQGLYRNPSTGKIVEFTLPNFALADMRTNVQGLREDIEYFLSATDGNYSAPRVPITADAYDGIYGGDYVGSLRCDHKQTYLAADVTNVATSLAVTNALTPDGRNIFVAGRPYLLMHRLPLPGEDVFASGTDANGWLKPAAEIITIDSGYTSGTTVTVARTFGGAARKKGAVIQAIPGVSASFNQDATGGLIFERERPSALVTHSAIDAGSQTVTVRFTRSAQQATAGGVVTHYGLFVLPKLNTLLYTVRSLPLHVLPVTVLAIDSGSLGTETVNTVNYTTITGTQFFDPSDHAIKSLVAGTYWVAVVAMNQASIDSAQRMSKTSTWQSVTLV